MSEASRILVVDDEPAVAEVLLDFLAEAGYTVDVALTGRDALTLIERTPPDVVLLDIRMPDMDGVEVLRRIRAAHPALPVIMITASDDIGVARATLKMGALDYVSKPFDYGYLAQAVAPAGVYRPTG
jgi:two-component system OmpR family response regulator